MSRYGSTGLLSEVTEALPAKLSKRAEAASSNYSAVVDFLQYIYSVWLRVIRRSDQGI